MIPNQVRERSSNVHGRLRGTVARGTIHPFVLLLLPEIGILHAGGQQLGFFFPRVSRRHLRVYRHRVRIGSRGERRRQPNDQHTQYN